MTTSDSSVEVVIPPIITAAIGARDSAPASSLKTSGIMANTIAAEVIKMGRIRSLPASISASVRGTPRSRKISVKSTIKIPFLVTRPMSMTNPNREKMFTVLPVSARPKKAPTRATGNENIIANGDTNDSYRATINM